MTPALATPLEVYSRLMLSDRLIALAQAADDAGFPAAAEKLVNLAFAVLYGSRLMTGSTEPSDQMTSPSKGGSRSGASNSITHRSGSTRTRRAT